MIGIKKVLNLLKKLLIIWREAYKYAKENDIFNPENDRGIKIERVSEIPQMKNNLTDGIISF